MKYAYSVCASKQVQESVWRRGKNEKVARRVTNLGFLVILFYIYTTHSPNAM